MMTNKIARKQVSFRLREDLLIALKIEARKANKSLSNFVECILMAAMYSELDGKTNGNRVKMCRKELK